LKKGFKIDGFKIGFFISVLVSVAYLIDVPFLDLMELKALDLRFVARGSVRPGDEVVIATIDEKSLDELGRWPWSRTEIARLVDTLTEYGAKVIGLDIVFSEPEENYGLEMIASFKEKVEELELNNKELAQYISLIEKEVKSDETLARAIRKSDRVILGYFFHASEKGLEHVKESDSDMDFKNVSLSKYPSVRYQSDKAKRISIKEAYAVESNLEKFSNAANGNGFFNVFPDKDGAVRWAPLVIQYKGMFFPSLPIKVLHSYLGSPLLSLSIADYGVDSIRLGKIVIPTDERGRILVNYYGPRNTFPCYSIADILNGGVAPTAIKDKIVLVGATAIGIYDMRITPFASVYPGVEIHASVIDNIIHQRFLIRPDWTAILDIAVILGLGLLLGLVLPGLRAASGVVVTLFFLLSFFMLNRYLFIQKGVWINIVYPFIVLLSVYVGVTVFCYVKEERAKKKIKGAFKYYVTASVVNEMLKNPEKLKLGGEKKELTVLFSDIRGFTTISERLSSEMLVKILNEYLTDMTDIVFKYDGFLDKYMGDAVMAVYGAPLDQADHAHRACDTALDMIEGLKVLQTRWQAGGTPKFNIGIGINTGTMVVGNMGSKRRFDYTVMGDSVNLGSRLEGANKQYNTNIIISEFTFEKVRDRFFCRELDSVKVKGKNLPVKIYELVGRRGVADEVRVVLDLFHEGLRQHKERRWKEAMETFNKVLDLKPDDYPSQLYLERIRSLTVNPPPKGWDGVFIMDTK